VVYEEKYTIGLQSIQLAANDTDLYQIIVLIIVLSTLEYPKINIRSTVVSNNRQ
jgi:hypothetical protein